MPVRLRLRPHKADVSIAWTPHHRCQTCTAGEGKHYEYCPDYEPEPGELYRLTKACPNCSIPEDTPCGNCHHPKGLHESGERVCSYFLACNCRAYRPMECRFGCYDGRIIPERVRYIFKWYLGMLDRPMLNTEIDQIVLTLDREAPAHYPDWPESNPSRHHDHVHVEMRQEDIERTLDEQQAEGGV